MYKALFVVHDDVAERVVVFLLWADALMHGRDINFFCS